MNAAVGGMANVAKAGLQVILLPVMAHLLGPAEFGVYALALPAVAFCSALADGGLGTSMVREPEESRLVWSTAFWVLLAAGLTLALLLTGWGVLLSDLMSQPRLSGIMAFLSLSLVLLTSSVIPIARLQRSGNLVTVAVADITGNLLAAGVAVTLAASGAGAWSLAAQYVTTFAVRSLILNASAPFRPSAQFSFAALGDHLSIGGSLLGGRMVDLAGRMVENLAFGRIFGDAALGAYTFANQAPRYICEAASNPIWAALYAHAVRAPAHEMAGLHLKLSRLLAALVLPAAGLLSASAPEVVTIVLGPKWQAAAGLIQILVPFFALNVVASQSGAILIANGRSAPVFWSVCVLSVGRVLAVCAGAWVGQIGMAWGIGLAYLVYTGIMFAAPSRTTGLPAGTLIRCLVPVLVSSLLASVICAGMLRLHQPGLLWTMASLVAGGIVYGAAMLALDGPAIRSDFRALRRLVLRRAGPPRLP